MHNERLTKIHNYRLNQASQFYYNTEHIYKAVQNVSNLLDSMYMYIYI